jgi:hypothetical protein
MIQLMIITASLTALLCYVWHSLRVLEVSKQQFCPQCSKNKKPL